MPKFFAQQVVKLSCHIIRTVQDFSNKNYFVFIVNAYKRKSATMPFGYGKIKTTSKKTGGAVDTVEKLQLNSSCEAEEKSLYKKQTKYTK